MRISYSSLDIFETCPKRFEYQIIEKIKVPKTKEQVFGTTLHSTLKYLYDQSPVFPSLDDVFNYFNIEWKDNAEKVKWHDEKEKNTYFIDGQRILREFYQKNVPDHKSTIIALESRFEAPIEDASKETSHILTGIIDRVDKIKEGVFEIIDYKTNKKMPGASVVDNNLQLSIYTLGFFKRWPNLAKLEDINLSLYFLKHGEKMTTKRNQEEIEALKTRVLKNIAEIEKNYFPPIPSALCNYCSYKNICPMWSHLYQKQTPADEEIKKMVDEYFSLKNQTDQTDEKLAEIKRQINVYLEKKGLDRVFGDEGFIVKTSQIKEEYDWEKIRPILERRGIWAEVLGLDKKKFESLLKKLPSNTLQEIESAKTKTRTVKILKAMKKSLEKIKRDIKE
jgi:putative RecB family exonuclease